ncbi:unnamed protein product [Clonostachys rosea]|uniref:Uncharacterized protein n=1 Tax=Bionectria ochroleuca TaxID=29856 RepID=A0ABY6UNF9_BIOOC|nr:unnamed protein product [Clonostachys rosea]
MRAVETTGLTILVWCRPMPSEACRDLAASTGFYIPRSTYRGSRIPKFFGHTTTDDEAKANSEEFQKDLMLCYHNMAKADVNASASDAARADLATMFKELARVKKLDDSTLDELLTDKDFVSDVLSAAATEQLEKLAPGINLDAALTSPKLVPKYMQRPLATDVDRDDVLNMDMARYRKAPNDTQPDVHNEDYHVIMNIIEPLGEPSEGDDQYIDLPEKLAQELQGLAD